MGRIECGTNKSNRWRSTVKPEKLHTHRMPTSARLWLFTHAARVCVSLWALQQGGTSEANEWKKSPTPFLTRFQVAMSILTARHLLICYRQCVCVAAAAEGCCICLPNFEELPNDQSSKFRMRSRFLAGSRGLSSSSPLALSSPLSLFSLSRSPFSLSESLSLSSDAPRVSAPGAGAPIYA